MEGPRARERRRPFESPRAVQLPMAYSSLRAVQLQVLHVVLVDLLDVRIRLRERDRLGKGVDIGGASACQPAVDGRLGGVVGGQRREDLLPVPIQSFAEGKGAELDV